MELIKVGYITNTHGIKGEIKVYPLTDNLDRFNEDIDFYIDNQNIKVKIVKSREYRGLVYLKLQDYDNINDVLKFKSKYLLIDEENRLDLPEDSYYISDLIGSDIVEDGKIIGTVKDVLMNSTNDIYLCRRKDNKEFMIPAVKEFIREVDAKNKKIHVKLIEGMY